MIADETRIISDAMNGDLDAFNRLVIAYQQLAFNVAYRILTDETTAEDATQAAFISAYKNLKSYRGGSFRAWLLRMVTNACYDELRRQKRRPTLPLEPQTEDGSDEMESPVWLADDAPDPEETYSQKELEQAVMDCLSRLPEEFRVISVLIDVQGMDYEEASQVVGKPLGTIKSRLARARLRLRDCMQRFRELLPAKFRLGIEDPHG